MILLNEAVGNEYANHHFSSPLYRFCICFGFIFVSLFCIVIKSRPLSHSTVAQQFFWSPFIVFCRFCYLSVSSSVLIVSIKLESAEIPLNKYQLANIFTVKIFSPLKLGLSCLWPLKVLS